MPSKFKIGEHVRFTSHTIGLPSAPGFYQIVKLMPSEHIEQRYKIKNKGEAHERIVRESQLEKD
ncbi:MAG TPA: hypothetical protein VNR41_03795 [Xanthobacteraceae bacterium]|jgi:hypothetical protein|nr:hypothetical protein [Xanthobacteraceae bacterium]